MAPPKVLLALFVKTLCEMVESQLRDRAPLNVLSLNVLRSMVTLHVPSSTVAPLLTNWLSLMLTVPVPPIGAAPELFWNVDLTTEVVPAATITPSLFPVNWLSNTFREPDWMAIRVIEFCTAQ